MKKCKFCGSTKFIEFSQEETRQHGVMIEDNGDSNYDDADLLEYSQDSSTLIGWYCEDCGQEYEADFTVARREAAFRHFTLVMLQFLETGGSESVPPPDLPAIRKFMNIVAQEDAERQVHKPVVYRLPSLMALELSHRLMNQYMTAKDSKDGVILTIPKEAEVL